jgi:hypothetical protein
VTPSYGPDRERCEILAESIDQFIPEVKHYLIVDRRDRGAFSHLELRNRTIIESEDILGGRFWRCPGRYGLWLSTKAAPVRGWIVQQILKLSAIDAIPERTLIFCDSDVAFIRPFKRSDLVVDGKIGLLDVSFVNDEVRQWSGVARKLIGLSPSGPSNRNHVGNMICWNRETISALRDRVQAHSGLDWQIAVARQSTFSEYILYGVFVREFLGYDAVDHAPSAVPLVKASWGQDLMTEDGMTAFFSKFDPRTVAVMIHSKDGVDLNYLKRHLKRYSLAL